MSAKYKSPSFLLPNELNTSANTANDTGINSLYSMNFDGNDYIDLGTYSQGTGLALNADMSISAWIKTSNLSSTQVVICNLTSGASSGGYCIEMNRQANGQYGILYDAATVGLQGSTILSSNTWYHIVMTRTGTSGNWSYNLYLNGNADGSATNVAQNFGNGSVAIGRFGAYDGGYFNGQIDEVAIFNRALTDGTGNTVNEIAALYDGTGSNIRPSNLMAANLNPVAYYPLGEQAQNTGYLDPSNPGNDMSGSEWQFPNGVLQDYVMDLNATGYIDCGNEDSVNITGALTVSAWVKPSTASNGNFSFVSKAGNYPNSNYILRGYSTGARFFLNGTTHSGNTSKSFVAEEWVNLIGIFRPGQSVDLYWNGSLSDGSTTSTSTTSISTVTNTLLIGSNTDQSQIFDGEMSNVAIWNSDQTANVANIYNNGSPQTTYTVTPQNWWKLNADSVYTPSAPNYTTALGFNSTKSDFDKVTVGDLTTLATPSNDITISLWAKLRTIANTQDKYGMIYSDKSGYIYFSLSGSVLKYESNLRGTTNLKDTTGIAPSELLKWHHIVVTFSGTEAKLYYNSQLLDTGTAGSATNFGEDTTIGTLRNTATTTYSFNGFISNVAVLQSALTSSQVSTLFNFGTPETNISFSPIHNWKLDNLTTGLNDTGSLASNNGTAGSVNGTGPVQESTSVAAVPSWKIPNELPIPTVNYTSALDFDGNDYISMSGVTLSNDFAFSLWFYTASSSALMFFLGEGNNWCRINNGVFDIKISGNQLSDNPDPSAEPTFNIIANQWNNLTVVRDSNDLFQVYLNGQVDTNYTPKTATQPGGGGNPNVDFVPAFIGRRNPNYFTGKLSNVSMWNNALTASQVSTIFNNGSPEVALSFSPVHWWKLNEGGSTITDYAGSSNGTNNGATKVDSNVYVGNVPVNGVSTTLPSTALQQSDLQFDSPYSNYSLSFDSASSDYLQVPNTTDFDFGTGDFTWSLWINYETHVNYAGLLYTGSSNSEYRLKFQTSGQILYMQNADGDSQVADLGANITGTGWHHLCLVRSSGTITTYLDGSAVDTDSRAGNVNSNGNDLLIGINGSSYFDGKMDELAIWNTALTSSQVLEIHNNGRPNNLTTFSGTAPTNWWRLGENAYFVNNDITLPNSIAGAPNGVSSGTATSMLSADAPGTYANGIGTNLDILDRVGDAPLSTANSQSYNMIPSDISPYVPGYVGDQISNTYSMAFDGVNDYFNAGNINGIEVSDFTVSLWVKFNGNQNSMIFFSGTSLSTNSTYVQRNNNVLYFGLGAQSNYIQSTPTVANNVWHHIVVVATGTSGKIYFNGSDTSASGAALSSTRTNLGQNFTIGRGLQSNGSNGFFVDGQIDEVAIFDKALTADQIKFDLYKPTSEGTNQTADIANNPNLPTPVAWYRMGD